MIVLKERKSNFIDVEKCFHFLVNFLILLTYKSKII